MYTIGFLNNPTDKDCAGVVELLRKLYGELPNPPTRTQIEETAKKNEVVLARAGSTIIGMATLVTYSGFGRMRARVEDVVVLPEWRRQGVGTRLMRHVQRLASDLGASVLDLETFSMSQEALGFYASLGYKDRSAERVVLRTTL